MSFRRSIAKRFFHGFTAIVILSISFAIGVLVSPIGFALDGMAHGKVLDGAGYFSIHQYRSTYFIQLLFSCSHYQSPEKANKVFDSWIGSATKVIERGPKYDRQGNIVGERAVTVSFDTAKDERY